MSDNTNEPKGAGTDYFDNGYANPNSQEAVPDLGTYVERRPFSSKVIATDYDFNSELRAWNDRLSLISGQGLPQQRLSNMLMGFNHRMASTPIPLHREYGGVTFITRPDLNLSAENIANSRRLSDMASQPRSSLDYSILAALDPDFELGFSDSPTMRNGRRKNRLGTPFLPDIPFDNLQAFIPLLSSQLMSLSGPPDNSIESWMSPEGLMREQWGMIDSTDEINYGYTTSTTLNNPIGDPCMKLATVWLEYMGGTKIGKFRPKIRNSIQRRQDYMSRGYTIRYDALGNILRFNVICVMWPTNNNAGAMANVDNTKPLQDVDSTVTLQWQCIGARYWDPAYMDSFNNAVALANPDMIPDPRYDTFVPMGAGNLRQLLPEEISFFNWYGYPHIDSWRRKLTWWVYQIDYDYVMKKGGFGAKPVPNPTGTAGRG